MNFVDFIKEATSTASQQAARLGLQGNGHGDWYDNNGKLVAKTVKGSLKFFGKKRVLVKMNHLFQIRILL